MNRLAPLSEEPLVVEDEEEATGTNTRGLSLKKWLRTHFLPFSVLLDKESDLKILLSVLACPLFPLSPQPRLPNNEVSSLAQYIIQHFTAATECKKLAGIVKNIFVTGKVSMAVVDELGGGGSSTWRKGCFVMWQMVPSKWLIELVLAGHKVAAGSDGNVAWRHTPWLGQHAAKGGVRPLRRALQGLDPLAISAVFSSAQYVGEKQVWGEDCFVLKISTGQSELLQRSDSTAELIKHVVFGYFSQKSGLLLHLEDSFLTRIHSPGSHPFYWETSMCTHIEEYRAVAAGREGSLVVAHAGRTSVFVSRFGDGLRGSGISVTRMEEVWSIDDVAFDVPGLSDECFIPPDQLKWDLHEDTRDHFE